MKYMMMISLRKVKDKPRDFIIYKGKNCTFTKKSISEKSGITVTLQIS